MADPGFPRRGKSQRWSHQPIITGRNEVVAKVMFLQVCVCPQGGEGVCLSACWDAIPPWMEEPPLDGEPPRDQADPPPDGGTPPGWRTPRMKDPPQDQADPPPRKQTPAYGLQAAVHILLECILVLVNVS